MQEEPSSDILRSPSDSFPSSSATSVLGNGERKRDRKRTVRRGKGKNKRDNNIWNDEWSIYYSNIRGYKSKSESLKSIVSALDPNIIVLNETRLKSKEKLKIENYKSFNRNRQDKNMGGVSISIRNDKTKHVVKTGEVKDDNEFLITRQNFSRRPIHQGIH